MTVGDNTPLHVSLLTVTQPYLHSLTATTWFQMHCRFKQNTNTENNSKCPKKATRVSSSKIFEKKPNNLAKHTLRTCFFTRERRWHFTMHLWEHIRPTFDCAFDDGLVW